MTMNLFSLKNIHQIEMRKKKFTNKNQKDEVMSKYFIAEVKKVRIKNRLMSTEVNVPSLLDMALVSSIEGNSFI